MPTDPYAELAAVYDRFFGSFAEHDPAAVAFYRRLFAAHGVRRVLDCACGTGRDLHLFHTLGGDVVGSDISAAMLARARTQLAAVGLAIPLHQLDYRRLPEYFAQPFDAVACLSSAILHMPDEAEAAHAFASMRAVLRPGGILVLTQGTTDRQWHEKPRFILATDTAAVTRLFVIDYMGRGARYHIVDVVHGEAGGRLETFSVDYAHMLLRDDYERLLRAVGFAHADFYGSFAFDPYDKTASPRLIVVAHNPEEEQHG